VQRSSSEFELSPLEMVAMRFLWMAMALLWLTTGALAEDDLVPILAWSNRDTFSSVSVGERNKINIGSLVQQSSFSQLGFVFVFSTEKVRKICDDVM
jgi:hypothetical protein